MIEDKGREQLDRTANRQIDNIYTIRGCGRDGLTADMLYNVDPILDKRYEDHKVFLQFIPDEDYRRICVYTPRDRSRWIEEDDGLETNIMNPSNVITLRAFQAVYKVSRSPLPEGADHLIMRATYDASRPWIYSLFDERDKFLDSCDQPNILEPEEETHSFGGRFDE